MSTSAHCIRGYAEMPESAYAFFGLSLNADVAGLLCQEQLAGMCASGDKKERALATLISHGMIVTIVMQVLASNSSQGHHFIKGPSQVA